ncbi:class I SAM-dependent methyltransferase [Hyphobacterium sp. CCMP332]|nr:class I SAM-dependent methyltransferase [Hyphobacterium sp. CCMP332]
MTNNYGIIAPFYDLLKKIVFGQSLIKAECIHLNGVSQESKLLVVGCGSSEFLEHIDTSKFKCINCIDKSAKMCEKSRKRRDNLNLADKIRIEKKDFKNFGSSVKYDVIALPFFLDSQKFNDIPLILDKCHSMLAEQGSLIITDFNSKTYRKSNILLIKSMYIFFRISTNIPVLTLFDTRNFIDLKKWKQENSYLSPKELIFSIKLKKIPI